MDDIRAGPEASGREETLRGRVKEEGETGIGVIQWKVQEGYESVLLLNVP